MAVTSTLSAGAAFCLFSLNIALLPPKSSKHLLVAIKKAQQIDYSVFVFGLQLVVEKPSAACLNEPLDFLNDSIFVWKKSQEIPHIKHTRVELSLLHSFTYCSNARKSILFDYENHNSSHTSFYGIHTGSFAQKLSALLHVRARALDIISFLTNKSRANTTWVIVITRRYLITSINRSNFSRFLIGKCWKEKRETTKETRERERSQVELNK